LNVLLVLLEGAQFLAALSTVTLTTFLAIACGVTFNAPYSSIAIIFNDDTNV
jgi:hypothetical protein